MTLGVALLLLGLQVAGRGAGLARLERAGARLWRQVAPLTRRLRPLDRAWKLLAVGALWGLLPCGLVYTALAGAATTADPIMGAALLAAFGVGTLPAVAGLGVAASRLGRLVSHAGTRVAAGALIAGYGAWIALGALAMAHA